MAKKKSTSDKRYAVDYRGLNAELIGNVIGVPRIDDLLDTWSKSKYQVNPSGGQRLIWLLPFGRFL